MAIEALNYEMTQQEFGELVGISQQAVSDIQARGVILSGQPGAVWLRSYCEHLREVAAGRVSSGDLDLIQERARLAKAQADRVELVNAQARKELAPVVTMSLALAKVGQQIAAILDGIPGVCKRRLNLNAAQIEIIQTEITKARNAAANIKYKPDMQNSGVIDDDIETAPDCARISE